MLSTCLESPEPNVAARSDRLLQVGRAGRFGTKGLAITFVASEDDSKVLNQVGQSSLIASSLVWCRCVC